LFRDLSGPYSLTGRRLTPAAYFFPGMPVYFGVNAFVTNFHLAMIFYGVVRYVPPMASLLFLGRQAFGRRSSARLFVRDERGASEHLLQHRRVSLCRELRAEALSSCNCHDGLLRMAVRSRRHGSAGAQGVAMAACGHSGGRNEVYHQFDLLAGIDKGALPLP